MGGKCKGCFATIKSACVLLHCAGICKGNFHLKCANVGNNEFQNINSIKHRIDCFATIASYFPDSFSSLLGQL